MGYDRRLKSNVGQSAAEGNNIIIPAVSGKRLRVYAFLLETVSTTVVTATFRDGESGVMLWQVTLDASAEKPVDRCSMLIRPHVWLFETSPGQPLILSLSAAQAVNWSVAYWDDESV